MRQGDIIMKNIAEFGRSMTEMLGALAIMGVLSVGGISAYHTAMDKYRSNKLLERLSYAFISVSTQRLIGKEVVLEDIYSDVTNPLTYVDESSDSSTFTLQIDNVSKGVCKNIKQQGLKSAQIIQPTDCDIQNTMIFQFDDTSVVSEDQNPDSHPIQDESACTAEQGVWCDEGCHPTGYNECQCPVNSNGRHGVFGKDGTTCCLDNAKYIPTWQDYGAVDISNCGCPDGGHLAADGVTCCNNNGQKWVSRNEYSGNYNAYDSRCGCPKDTDTDLDVYIGTDGTTCCNANNFAWTGTWYGGYDPACGCPDGGKLKGPDGDKICCQGTSPWRNNSYWGSDSRCNQ